MEASQLIIHTEGQVCDSKRELTHSDVLYRVLCLYVAALRKRRSPLLDLLRLTQETPPAHRCWP